MSRSAREDVRPTRTGLSGRLRALREATVPRVSQTAAAKAIGASQNKISRAETGHWVLTPDEVRTLARLYGASSGEQRTLAAWAAALAPGEVDARVILRRGGGTAAFQARVRQLEQGAELIRAYQPGMILGQLQTEAYARVVFGGDEAAVAERLRRSQLLLGDASRRWVLVQPIGALLWNLGGAEVMAEQIDALIEASRLPHVDLRIIGPEHPMTFAVTHGFHLYDHKAVVVGILTGTTIDDDQRAVTQYGDVFERLHGAGAGDDQARNVLARIAADYRDA
jgi:Domain of unknown function (DUF5753)/Helix-turn-helix domain